MNEIQIICLGDVDYPRALLDLKDPPKQLYVKGGLDLLKQIYVVDC